MIAINRVVMSIITNAIMHQDITYGVRCCLVTIVFNTSAVVFNLYFFLTSLKCFKSYPTPYAVFFMQIKRLSIDVLLFALYVMQYNRMQTIYEQKSGRTHRTLRDPTHATRPGTHHQHPDDAQLIMLIP